MSVKHDKQRLYASLLSVGAGFLLFRTFHMMFVDHAFELLVSWVSALLVAECILDLACLVAMVRWAITNDERDAGLPNTCSTSNLDSSLGYPRPATLNDSTFNVRSR